MSTFDDLTLAEVDEISTVVLKGKSIGAPDTDNLMLAGGVMWMTQRRDDPQLAWDAFKARTKMGDIKAFSIQMEVDQMAVDPTNVPHD